MKTTKVKQPTKKELELEINKLTEKRALEILSECINPERVLALAIELDLTTEDAKDNIIEEADGELFGYGREEYRVLTDSEADEQNDEYIDNYIDECILPELPKPYQSYFDNEAFKRDARMDGRGHNLSGYDGSENDQKINGTYYYIFRTN